MKTPYPSANLPPTRARRAQAASLAKQSRSLTLGSTFVFVALAGSLSLAFGGGWLLRGRQLSRGQAPASPAVCLVEPPGDQASGEVADLPPPRLSLRSLATPAPAELDHAPPPAPAKPTPPDESMPPATPRPDLAPGQPLGMREMAELSRKERGAVIAQAQLESAQIRVLDEQVSRLNDRIEEWLTDHETNAGKLPGDRQATSSRDFMMGVLTYVTQAQGELTAQLGDRFAAAAQAVDFDLSSQIDSHLLERLASVVRPRS